MVSVLLLSCGKASATKAGACWLALPSVTPLVVTAGVATVLEAGSGGAAVRAATREALLPVEWVRKGLMLVGMRGLNSEVPSGPVRVQVSAGFPRKGKKN